jgi:LytS/YehU family sensor histidine kinase
METFIQKFGNTNSKILKFGFWDIITGIPSGLLIFMGTVLANTVVSSNHIISKFVSIGILAFVAFFVGILAGITRLKHGPATALSASLIAAGILGYLWLTARPGDEINSPVIGPIGIIITITTCPTAGWIGAKLRKVI